MHSVLVLFANGSEELETVSIVDILRRAGVNVTLAGLEAGPLRGSRQTVLLPDTTLDAALTQHYDMLVLPGGQPGTNHLKADARVLKLAQQMYHAGHYVCAICAAPAVLAAAGLLDGEDGKLITSRGPGTAMDFALTLVERLCGHAKRVEVEAGLVR